MRLTPPRRAKRLYEHVSAINEKQVGVKYASKVQSTKIASVLAKVMVINV
jgi:hypothetical protein